MVHALINGEKKKSVPKKKPKEKHSLKRENSKLTETNNSVAF